MPLPDGRRRIIRKLRLFRHRYLTILAEKIAS
jgi:hypothetical protein